MAIDLFFMSLSGSIHFLASSQDISLVTFYECCLLLVSLLAYFEVESLHYLWVHQQAHSCRRFLLLFCNLNLKEEDQFPCLQFFSLILLQLLFYHRRKAASYHNYLPPGEHPKEEVAESCYFKDSSALHHYLESLSHCQASLE